MTEIVRRVGGDGLPESGDWAGRDCAVLRHTEGGRGACDRPDGVWAYPIVWRCDAVRILALCRTVALIFYFAIFFVAGTGSFSAGRAGIRYSLSVGYVRFGYIRYICLDRTAVRPRTGLPSDGRFRFFIE